MSCEEELNAWRQAERELAEWRTGHLSGAGSPGPGPGGDVAGPVAMEAGDAQRLAELTAAVRDRQNAYNRCLDRAGAGSGSESLMRDDTGAPRGGGAGPPM